MVVEEENVPHFQKMSGDKMRAPTSPSNVSKILNQFQKQQQAVDRSKNPVQSLSFRTNTPSESASKPMMTAMGTPRNNSLTTTQAFPTLCAHVHKLLKQVLKPGYSVALQKVKTPNNGRTSVTRLLLTKQQILSHYSGYFEGIGQFLGELYKFHLEPKHKPAKHAPRRVPIHLEESFKQEINSLVELGILEEVTEHTDWVNSYVIVEKDTPIDSSNHYAPNHSINRKLRKTKPGEPYHTCSVDEITTKCEGITVFTIVDFKKGYWMMVLHPDSRKLTCMALSFGRFQWTRLPMGTVAAQHIF